MSAPVRVALGDLVDVSTWGEAAHGSGAAGECSVCAGEGVDAVVVGGVGEAAEFVEEVVAVAAADDFDQPVFGCGCGAVCAYVLGAGGALAADDVAAQHMPFVAVGDGSAGRAGFLFDRDLD